MSEETNNNNNNTSSTPEGTNINQTSSDEGQKQQQQQQDSSSPSKSNNPTIKKLFIGNLSFKVRESDLKAFVEENVHCKVHSANIATKGPRQLGFGFLELDVEDADRVLSELNGKELEGRKVLVEVARSQRNKKPRTNQQRFNNMGRRAPPMAPQSYVIIPQSASQMYPQPFQQQMPMRPPRQQRGPPMLHQQQQQQLQQQPLQMRVQRPQRRQQQQQRGQQFPSYYEPNTNNDFAGGTFQKRQPRPYFQQGRRPPMQRQQQQFQQQQQYFRQGQQMFQPQRRMSGNSPYGRPPRRNMTQSDNILFVSNLPYIVDEDGLLQIFSELNVKSASVARRPDGSSRGFGFVEFPSDKDLKDALANLDKIEVEGRVLGIKPALIRAPML